LSDIAISVENLSKVYLIGHHNERERYTTLRDAIARHVHNLGRKTKDMISGRQIVQGDEVEEFWALNDVSFEVKRGEVLGVIGRNGAGKSTLLKVLSRITEPTEGRVRISGRVASLLEVGTGFHPELTGRENIFLNGAILGMSRGEIKRKFDEIVDFAEVERFLDTPVKRFSSGMYVRLAFAVAAHLEPEILVVDEVLAVGDAEFQKKCLTKMQDVAGLGRTVLFVSHNMAAVTRLCSTGILLEKGRVTCRSDVGTCLSAYHDKVLTSSLSSSNLDDMPRSFNPDQRIRIKCISCISVSVLQDCELKINIHVAVAAKISDVIFGIGFCHLDGSRILSSDSDYAGFSGFDFHSKGSHTLELTIAALPLAAGQYLIDVGCRTSGGQMLDNVQGALSINVLPSISSTIVNGSGYRTALVKANWNVYNSIEGETL
jgi:lipopolysaccharide transport system ATP-binding protein